VCACVCFRVLKFFGGLYWLFQWILQRPGLVWKLIWRSSRPVYGKINQDPTPPPPEDPDVEVGELPRHLWAPTQWDKNAERKSNLAFEFESAQAQIQRAADEAEALRERNQGAPRGDEGVPRANRDAPRGQLRPAPAARGRRRQPQFPKPRLSAISEDTEGSSENILKEEEPVLTHDDSDREGT
jgi:hypothetical protein